MSFAIAIIFFLFSHQTFAASEQVEFTSKFPNEIKVGHALLKWSSDSKNDDTLLFTVEKSATEDFQSAQQIYQGNETSTFLSGLSDGKYYFRVKSQNSSWSSPINLTVVHYSQSFALSLFGLGLLSFIGIVIVIFLGNRADTKASASL